MAEEQRARKVGPVPKELRIENAIKPPPYSGMEDQYHAVAAFDITNAKRVAIGNKPISMEELCCWMQNTENDVHRIKNQPEFLRVLYRITRRHTGALLPLLDEQTIKVVKEMLESDDPRDRRNGLDARSKLAEELGLKDILPTEAEPDAEMSGEAVIVKTWNMFVELVRKTMRKECTCGAFGNLSPIRCVEELKKFATDFDDKIVEAEVGQAVGELQRPVETRPD